MLVNQRVQQFAEVVVKLIRPPWAGADVHEKQEAVEPVGRLPFAMDDALEDRA
jgi:hypothetical protein